MIKETFADPHLLRSSRFMLILLGLLTSIDAMSIDIYMPAMPMIQEHFGTTATRVQTSLSAFFVGVVIGQLVWGPVSDRFGRYRPMMVGLVLFLVGSLLAIVAASISTFITARFIQALGASAGIVLTRAIVNDIYEKDQAPRIFSLLMQILGGTAIVSPLLGGAILLTGHWRPIFALLTVVGIAAILLCFARLPETHPADKRLSPGFFELINSYSRLFKNARYLAAALTSGICIAGMFVILAGSSYYYIQTHNWSAPEYSLVYAAMSLLFILACQGNIWLLRIYKAEHIARVALRIQLIVGLLLAALFMLTEPNLWVVTALLTIALSLLGFIFGNVTAFTMSIADGQAGTASGLLGVIQFILSAALLPFATAASDIGLSMSVTLAVCGVISLLFWHWAERGQTT